MAFSGLPLRWVKSANNGSDFTVHHLEVPNPVEPMRSLEFFRQLSHAHKWIVSFWILESKDSSVRKSEMLPRKMAVSKFPSIPDLVCWKGKQAETKDREDILARKKKEKVN